MTDEQRVERLKKFAEENKQPIKNFGMLKKFEDSQRFLQENPQLVCEETASQLCLWAIDLEVEEVRCLSAQSPQFTQTFSMLFYVMLTNFTRFVPFLVSF